MIDLKVKQTAMYCVVAAVAVLVTWHIARRDVRLCEGEGRRVVVKRENKSCDVAGNGGQSEKSRSERNRYFKVAGLAFGEATDDLSGANVRIRTDELEPTMAEKGLNAETLEELRKLFADFESGKLTDEHFLQSLCCYQPHVVLAAARSMLRFGTKNEKCNALWAVGMLHSTDTRNALEVRQGGGELSGVLVSSELGSADGADSSVESYNAEADLQRQSCGVISAINAGLSDADPDVRETAFEVMKAMPAAESTVVASQAMSGKDVELQAAILDAAKGGTDDLSVRISLMGAGSEDASIRAAALENLKGVSGQSFQSQHDASVWYEQHAQEFQAVSETGQIENKNN